MASFLTPSCNLSAEDLKDEKPKKTIGATAQIEEITSGAKFLARVDTGAESCSLHVKQIEVENANSNMRKNWKKKIRFLVTSDENQKDHWIESKIQSTVIVKTSEKKERRYKTWVTFAYDGVTKRVLVTLNDRSKMDYSLLIGRNFLKEDFVVDVSKSSTD